LVSIESLGATSYQSLIVTLDISSTVFEILTFKAKNGSFSPPLPCLTLPLGVNFLEFRDETYPAKTKGMGLPYGENFIILTSTVFN